MKTLFTAILMVFVIFSGCGKEDRPVNNDPMAHFSHSVQGLPVTVQFTNTSASPGGPAATYLWNFGDGTTSTLNSPDHTYSIPGVYVVRLTQTSSTGVEDIITYTVEPFTAGSGGNSGTSGANFIFLIPPRQFDVTFTNTSMNATSYLWSFGDGTTSSSNDTALVHTYEQPGNYQVSLTATGNGTSDVSTITLSL